MSHAVFPYFCSLDAGVLRCNAPAICPGYPSAFQAIHTLSARGGVREDLQPWGGLNGKTPYEEVKYKMNEPNICTSR
ncbi:hypothetical protein ACFL6I_18605 [candidate division KSB1 bacterium]